MAVLPGLPVDLARSMGDHPPELTAFTLATSVSESCHEKPTEAAILRFAATLAEQIEAGLPIVVPNDRVIEWRW